jgi:acetyl esterase/lipase
MHLTRITIPLFALAAWADAPAQQVIPLWENGAPGFESRRNEPEKHQDWWYKNIHNPSLTVFLPPAGKASGTAVIVAAGGGHRELVFNPEGVEPAQYLASLGVTAFALKYRLFREPGSPYKVSHTAEDIRRAVRTVRARAAEWQLDPARIGVMGWSAGGEVAAMVAYPPVAGDDEYVAGVMFDLTRKYRDAGASVEAHIYAQGKHAFNMGQRSQYVSIRHWPQRLAEWLEDRGYLRRAAP